MPVKYLRICMIVFTMAFVSSCTKTADGIQGPAGPAGVAGKSVTDLRSAIYGYVSQVNQYTVADSTLDSVYVSTVMGDSVLSVQTDKAGKYILPDLKSGTYRIMFKRKGYDSLAVNADHIAGNEDQFLGIVQMDGTQTTRIQLQTMQILQSPFDMVSKYLNMNSTLSGPAFEYVNRRYMDIYFSDSPDLNAHNALYVFNAYTHNEGTNILNTQVFFAGSEINGNRFSPGDTVYMKSYIVPPYSFNTTWFDSRSYQTIAYPYVSDSLSNYFIWPN